MAEFSQNGERERRHRSGRRRRRRYSQAARDFREIFDTSEAAPAPGRGDRFELDELDEGDEGDALLMGSRAHSEREIRRMAEQKAEIYLDAGKAGLVDPFGNRPLGEPLL